MKQQLLSHLVAKKYLHLSAFVFLISFFVSPNVVLAWAYNEHAKLSFEAYTLACQQLQNSDDERLARHRDVQALEALCTIERRYCYAHQVAVAADYVLKPIDLINQTEYRNFLHNGDNDCRDLDHIKLSTKMKTNLYLADAAIEAFDDNKRALDTGSKALKSEQMLYYPDLNKSRMSALDDIFSVELNDYWPIIRTIKLGLLATENKTHFHPDAPTKWDHYLNSLQHGDPIRNAFAYHSFSMHFLQDAFSSGHYGIKRDDYKQAYGNAYHDRMSATGYFVKTKQHNWHSYGDEHLYTPSTYVLLDDDVELSDKNFIVQIEAALSGDDIRFYLSSVDSYNSPINSAVSKYNNELDSDFVLTLPYRKSGFLCFFYDVCDNHELLFTYDEKIAYDPRHRCRERMNKGGIRVTTCDETHRYVLEQSVRNMSLFLNCMTLDIGPCYKRVQAKLDRKQIQDNFPEYYRVLAQNNESRLNKLPSLIAYDDYLETDYEKNGSHVPAYELGAFGYGLTCDSNDCNDGNQFSFSYNINHLTTARWSIYEHKSDAQQFSNELSAIRYFDLIDRFEWSRNIAGVNPFIQLTASDRSNKSADNSLQCGAGIRVDLHIAKFIVFYEYAKLFNGCHYDLEFNSVDGTDETRMTIGIEVATIRLKNSK